MVYAALYLLLTVSKLSFYYYFTTQAFPNSFTALILTLFFSHLTLVGFRNVCCVQHLGSHQHFTWVVAIVYKYEFWRPAAYSHIYNVLHDKVFSTRVIFNA